MDHWGDPWADSNVEQQKSPTKNAVISPPPSALAPAPVLLNGFLDDAGWGNEEESFGDWTNSTATDATPGPFAETQAPTSSRLKNDEISEDFPRWDVDERAKDIVEASDGAWAGQKPDSSDLDNGTSDTSETSTTVPTDVDPDAHRDTNELPTQLQPDDTSSARPSTSQSETSRHAAPDESPRTSLEEEQIIEKHSIEETRSNEGHSSLDKRQGEEEDDVSSSGTDSTEDGYGTSTADTLLTEGLQSQNDAAETAACDTKEDVHKPKESRIEPAASPPLTTTTASPPRKGVYQLDTSLLDELFPPQKNQAEPDDVPEDPVYSTSARKAWYRLTRKQTMREFNSGNSDDSYIRVTWLSSQIRSEVHKTVARWAREDRMSGTGPGAGASFYWDTPATPIEPKIPRGHQRTKTSVPTQRIAAPVRQSLPPVATNSAAAFNWSSPTSTIDPWKQDSPGLQSAVSSATSNPIAAHSEQTKEFRAAPMELAHGVGETKEQPSVISPETPAVASTIPPPPPATTSENSWGDFNALETNNTVTEQHATIPDDEDDDWGEMISSPTISAPVSAFPSAISTPPNGTVSPFAPAPDTSLIQDQSADAMHAASIVRLKSTISPTSAIFGRKSFVPLGSEPGPIGPGILKPVKRPAVSTPEKVKNERPAESLPKTLSKEQAIPQVSDAENAHGDRTENPEPLINDTKDDFSVFEYDAPKPQVAKPMTPPQVPVRNEMITDSWADADFSIFESAPTAATSHKKPTPDPADSFSVFRTPPRPTSSASSAKTFTRSSPPRNITPPAIQPLTGATNSAQRRKNEEEQTIREVLAGLPDLSYMLR
ncbi:hypothetical protein yc1106_00093 [Curvularia clavata]|uniref:Uncharacterized protein n=1 Tax=Curvularia clavata TaxID=95742 RepID=A0A9Q9DNR1_CURCL|nr:hypothetical protein yc1106_00093 [Curvularia clavata]